VSTQAVPVRSQVQPATPQAFMSPAVWFVPMLLPISTPLVALVMWVKRDLCAGLAACAAGTVGVMLWSIFLAALFATQQPQF
jgi:hypothetical protein